jgi:ribosomal protein S18 acetylase RimI-like enzyme
MKVVHLNTNNESTIGFIVDNLINASVEKPNKEHLNILLTDDRTYVFAVIIKSDIIGYALVYKFPSLYESKNLADLYDIEVLEQHRRKGAGSLLIKTILTKMREDNVAELWLGTAVDNVEGQALFSATGGIRSGEAFNDFTYRL